MAQNKKRGKEVVAVGLLAKDFKAKTQLNALKYESAVYKILAIVGAIAHKHQLCASFSVELSVLLPFNEYASRHWLEDSLRNYLPSFYWCGKELNVELSKFQCLPEGYGGISFLLRQKGEQWLQDRRIAAIMFGHRNTSFLLFERGGFHEGKVSDLGFYQLLEKIIERSAGQQIESLMAIIHQIGDDIRSNNPLIQFLLKSQEIKNRKQEERQLIKAIVTSRQEYWVLLQEWLSSVIPRSLNEIILLGGVAQYYRKELSERYSWTNLHWGDELVEEISTQFRLPSSLDRQEILAYRLIDIYGYFSYLNL